MRRGSEVSGRGNERARPEPFHVAHASSQLSEYRSQTDGIEGHQYSRAEVVQVPDLPKNEYADKTDAAG